jgi:hypothetical protein
LNSRIVPHQLKCLIKEGERRRAVTSTQEASTQFKESSGVVVGGFWS